MDNQQPSFDFSNCFERLAINAHIGDGCFWRHPECVNFKLVFTSTDLDLLKYKQSLFPDIFSKTINSPPSIRKGTKTNMGIRNESIYVLRTFVHPYFTNYKSIKPQNIINNLTLFDFVLWFLDDGCVVKRTDCDGLMFLLSIGGLCFDQENEVLFLDKVKNVFNTETGRLFFNMNGKSRKNMNWRVPYPIAFKILSEINKILPENKNVKKARAFLDNEKNQKRFRDYPVKE